MIASVEQDLEVRDAVALVIEHHALGCFGEPDPRSAGVPCPVCEAWDFAAAGGCTTRECVVAMLRALVDELRRTGAIGGGK